MQVKRVNLNGHYMYQVQGVIPNKFLYIVDDYYYFRDKSDAIARLEELKTGKNKSH